MAETSRWGISYPEGTDAPDVPKWMKDMALDLDDHAKDDQGLLSARPTSTVGTPGKSGRYYYATDVEILYRDNGTGWNVVSGGTAVGIVEQSGNYKLTTSMADITSMKLEISPKVKSNLLVIGSFLFDGNSKTSTFNLDVRGNIALDGVEIGSGKRAEMTVSKDGQVAAGSVCRSWLLVLEPGLHTITARAAKSLNEAEWETHGSSFSYQLSPA